MNPVLIFNKNNVVFESLEEQVFEDKLHLGVVKKEATRSIVYFLTISSVGFLNKLIKKYISNEDKKSLVNFLELDGLLLS